MAAQRQIRMFEVGVEGSALIEGEYRYTLWRRWARDQKPRIVNWIMLNPSKADALRDDATIRRCIGFARLWQFNGIVLTNLFALRSTDPRAILGHGAPVGPENDRHILEQARGSHLVVCAWGAWGRTFGRGEDVVRMLCGKVELHFLATTREGQPGHPLRLRADLWPMAWVY